MNIDEKGAEEISSALNHLKKLNSVSINLSKNNIGDKGA